MKMKNKALSSVVFGMIIILLFVAVLAGSAKTEILQDAKVETEEQNAQAEDGMTEAAEDADKVLENADGVEDTGESAGRTSTVFEVSTGEDIDWAIWSEGIYCYSDGDLCGYLSEAGDRITSCIYEKAAPFSEGLACVYRDGKYGYIGKDGETALPFVYDQASSFREGVAYFSMGEEYGFIDKEGNVILELTDCDSISSFREGLAYFSVDGQYGYMDKNGEIIVKPIYDDAGYFYEGLSVVVKDGLGGVIGKDGKEILAPEYIGVSTEDTCIIAQKEDRFFFFDTEGKEVSSGAWDWITRENDIFYIYEGDMTGFADKNGKVILEPLYEEIRPIPERGLVMVRNADEEYGMLDYEGQITVPFCHYDSVSDFVKGRAVVELNEKYGLLQYDGTLEMPIEYDEIRLFSDGSMAVWTGDVVELTGSGGNRILTGKYKYLYSTGDGYETDNLGTDEKTKFWDDKGNLISEYDYGFLSSAYGVKNTYMVKADLNGGRLLKKGTEDEEVLEEVLLTNQITPKIGAFKNFMESGSVSALAGGVPFTEDMERMRQWWKYSKLYRIGEKGTIMLYFYAQPLYHSNFRESNSGLYLVNDGRAEQLIGAGECGGSMGGDKLCFWYDTKDGRLKPGTSGNEGGFGGSMSGGDVYELKQGKMVLENSFANYYQDVLNYSEETLLENAELFYNPEGGTYTEETILEAEAVTEYEVNEKRVSRQEYEEARGRYRRYVPLEMCERR